MWARLYACALLLALAAPALGAEPAAKVWVVGEAKAQVRPDMAILSLSVSVVKPDAKEAAAESARVSQAVIDGLAAAGVAADDIQTTGLSLFPEFAGVLDAGSRKVSGYRANENLSVRVRALGKAGTLAGEAVEHGALYQGLRFDISDRDQRQDGLRAAAVENARHRAELYAKGAHMKLGPPREIVAQGAAARPPFPLAGSARAMAAGVAAPPVEGGLITLEERVDVSFDLAAP